MAIHFIPERIQQELLRPNSVNVQQLQPGGLSGASVWRAEGRWEGARVPLALRCWPAQHPTPQRLSQIHEALIYARRAGVLTIPALLPNASGRTYTSDGQRLWELSQWLPGAADYLQQPSLERLQAAMQALAQVHRVWSDGPQHQSGLSPSCQQRSQRLQDGLDHVPDLLRIEPPATEPLATLFRQTVAHLATWGPAWLADLQQLHAQAVPLHFVMRDVWSDHVVFEGPQVSGFIDFGAARLDEPATDVARLLGSLEPLNPAHWRLGWQAYQAVNPHVDLKRVAILDRVGTLLSALQWLQWLVIEQREFRAKPAELIARWQQYLRRLDQRTFIDIDGREPGDRNGSLEQSESPSLDRLRLRPSIRPLRPKD